MGLTMVLRWGLRTVVKYYGIYARCLGRSLGSVRGNKELEMAKDRNLVGQAAGIMSAFWIGLGKEIQAIGGTEEDILVLGSPENTLFRELVSHCAKTIVDTSRLCGASLSYWGSKNIP